jgi:hypothetical protein
VRRSARHAALRRGGEARYTGPESGGRHHQRLAHLLGARRRARPEEGGDGRREAEAAVRVPVGRQEHPAPRHSEEVHRRRRLRAGHPPARHAVRARGAPAVTGGEARFSR